MWMCAFWFIFAFDRNIYRISFEIHILLDVSHIWLIHVINCVEYINSVGQKAIQSELFWTLL